MSGRIKVVSPGELRRLLEKAEGFYADFHWGNEPSKHMREDYLPAPPVLVELGTMQEITYESAKAPATKREGYIHKFSRPFPRLACDPSGRQLYIVGGRYTIEWRGIVH